MNDLQKNRIIPDMPEAQYHAHPAMSKGKLWPMKQSAAHFLHNLNAPMSDPTPQMFLGTLVHALVLEPDTFESRYFVGHPPDVNRRTDAGKTEYAAWLQSHLGRQWVLPEVFASATQMAHNVLAHPMLREIFNTRIGWPECSIFWQDLQTEIECKARVDLWTPALQFAIDLKIAADASPSGFSRACAKFGYYLQDAHYMEGLRNVMSLETVNPMLFVVVENKPPYAVGLYTLDDDSRDFAERERQRLMQHVEECSRNGEWPGYSTQIDTLSLPRWTLMQEVTT